MAELSPFQQVLGATAPGGERLKPGGGLMARLRERLRPSGWYVDRVLDTGVERSEAPWVPFPSVRGLLPPERNHQLRMAASDADRVAREALFDVPQSSAVALRAHRRLRGDLYAGVFVRDDGGKPVRMSMDEVGTVHSELNLRPEINAIRANPGRRGAGGEIERPPANPGGRGGIGGH
jgi:hypothetical protein